MAPVSSIRNLGPRSDASFARAGIGSAEALREMGADAAYARLLAHGTRPHFIGYYAIVLGLQGRLWTEIEPVEKARLRQRFDTIVAAHRRETPPDIERELDRLGVGPRR